MRCRAQRREVSVDMAETDLHSVFVFQVGRDGKCFDACWAEQGSSIAGGSSMCRETSTPTPAPSAVRASEIGFGKQGGRGRQRNFTRESEDRSLRRARKAALIHKPRQRGTVRQQATESQLTFDLSGWPKASPLEGMVRRRSGRNKLYGATTTKRGK